MKSGFQEINVLVDGLKKVGFSALAGNPEVRLNVG